MKVLLVHPSPLMYSEIFLRLEPIGLERVASAVRAAGHEVRLLDLQLFGHADYYRELADFAPHAVGFSLNYLANVPEVLDLAKETKRRRPGCFVFAGGHSGSFIAEELLEHAAGALDALVRGEGEAITPRLLEAAGDPRLATLPGGISPDGAVPARPRPDAPSPQVLHRRARPVRLGGADARLPVGLLVLQRVDLLRPLVPQGLAGGGRRRPRADRRAQRVPRRRRGLHPSRARLCDRARAGEA
jgi:radical SAM superfamily enzyme YgiQ (UPF0313 family)